MFTLPEACKIVELLSPAADAGGRTGDYVSLKNVQRAWIVFHITQGNAATIALSLMEATAVAPTGAQAVTPTFPIWSNLDCAADDLLVRRTDAANYTTDAGVKHKIVVFEIDPARVLTVESDYDCLAPVTGASNAANITQCMAYLLMRYQGDQPPSTIID